MAVVDTIPQVGEGSTPGFESGPYWDSFEQLRMGGSKGLQGRIGEGQVGRLNVKGDEFVIMRAGTFTQLYGLAQDASRLIRAARLIRQGVRLALHTGGSKVAVEHLRDLTDLLPEPESEPALESSDLSFDRDERADDEDDAMSVEIDPAKVRRPTFGREN
jgi:hypothetical protein